MSKKSATAQLFSINKSPLLIRWLFIAHGLAIFASLANGLFWTYKLLALAAVGLSLFFYLRNYHYQFKPCQIRYQENSGWSVAVANHDFQAITILPSTVLTTWLIVLHFRAENSKFQSLVILNDALHEKDYRALTVGLKVFV